MASGNAQGTSEQVALIGDTVSLRPKGRCNDATGPLRRRACRQVQARGARCSWPRWSRWCPKNALLAQIEPHYPKEGRGWHPYSSGRDHDAGYTGADKREELKGTEFAGTLPSAGGQRTAGAPDRQVRSRVEHPFRLIKRQFGPHQGALPRAGRERRAVERVVRLVESVDGAQEIAGDDREGASSDWKAGKHASRSGWKGL